MVRRGFALRVLSRTQLIASGAPWGWRARCLGGNRDWFQSRTRHGHAGIIIFLSGRLSPVNVCAQTGAPPRSDRWRSAAARPAAGTRPPGRCAA